MLDGTDSILFSPDYAPLLLYNVLFAACDQPTTTEEVCSGPRGDRPRRALAGSGRELCEACELWWWRWWQAGRVRSSLLLLS
jgi:hypothetical protein